jgi:O-antigen ligase
MRSITITGKHREHIINTRIAYLFVTLALLLLPIERVVFPLSLKLIDLVLLLITGVGCLFFLRENHRIQVPLALPAWLILLASLFATITTPFMTDSILAIVQELYLFAWFVILTNILTIFKPSDFDNLIKIWSIIATLEAAASLMGMFQIGPAMFYTSPIKDNILDTGAFNRGFGTFANPNATGAYLVISFFILQATGWPKWVRTILGIFLYAGIYSTGSMGAILSAAIGFIVLLILNIVLNNRRINLLLSGILAIGLAIIMLVVVFFKPVQSLSQFTAVGKENELLALTLGRLTHSVTGRQVLVQDAWQVFERYPFGTGPNTADAHSDYLAFLFDRGLLGFVGWVLMVITTLITPFLKINRQKDGFRLWQILSLWAGFLAISIIAFTHEISHFRQVWVLMAFIYAAYYGFEETDNQLLTVNNLTREEVSRIV